jgi:hypothetical protein
LDVVNTARGVGPVEVTFNGDVLNVSFRTFGALLKDVSVNLISGSPGLEPGKKESGEKVLARSGHLSLHHI